jgi:hypothetical protein
VLLDSLELIVINLALLDVPFVIKQPEFVLNVHLDSGEQQLVQVALLDVMVLVTQQLEIAQLVLMGSGELIVIQHV